MTADHVTLEDGTGLVHAQGTVRGHQTGLQGLDAYCQGNGDGTYDGPFPSGWSGCRFGMPTEVMNTCAFQGHLLYAERFMHSTLTIGTEDTGDLPLDRTVVHRRG